MLAVDVAASLQHDPFPTVHLFLQSPSCSNIAEFSRWKTQNAFQQLQPAERLHSSSSCPCPTKVPMSREEEAAARRDLGIEQGNYLVRLRALHGADHPSVEQWAAYLEWADREKEIQMFHAHNKEIAMKQKANGTPRAATVANPQNPRVAAIRQEGAEGAQKRHRPSTTCQALFRSESSGSIEASGSAPLARQQPQRYQPEPAAETNPQTSPNTSRNRPVFQPHQVRSATVPAPVQELCRTTTTHLRRRCGPPPGFRPTGNPNATLAPDLTRFMARYRIDMKPYGPQQCDICGEPNERTCWCAIKFWAWYYEDEGSVGELIWRGSSSVS